MSPAGQPARPAMQAARRADSVPATEKYLAWSVRKGHRCEFSVYDCEPISGYLGAIDRFNYVVLVPGAGIEKHILHKGSVPRIELEEHRLLTAEDKEVQKALAAILDPFREWVMKKYFHQNPPRLAPVKETAR